MTLGTDYTKAYAPRWGVKRGAWDKARRFFLMVNPTCAHCGRWATIVDHIQPHRGSRQLFWDTSNWQPMCARCHGRKTRLHDGWSAA